jgi:hypothetical protein
MNSATMEAAGMVKVGDWGFGDDTRGSGAVYSHPVNYDAVKAAYEEIEDGDLGPNVLDAVIAAGGVFVRD